MKWFVFSGSRLLGTVVAASAALAESAAEAMFSMALPVRFSVVPVS